MEKTLPDFPQSLRKIAVFPEDHRYDKVRSNDFKVGRPKVVILAETEKQVRETIRYAARINGSHKDYPLSVRSGGHGASAVSVNDHGIILDLSPLNRVTILDRSQGIVKVQAGALWGGRCQGAYTCWLGYF